MRRGLAAALQVVAAVALLAGGLLLAVDAGSDDVGTLPYAIPWTVLAVAMLLCATRARADQGSDPYLAMAALIGAGFCVGILILDAQAVI